jgi:glyoxylate carboligase
VRAARSGPADIVALSGDYDFQFMIEELAVGAQHKLPYLHVLVNNSYLGLIRQSQRGFNMDFEVEPRVRQHQRVKATTMAARRATASTTSRLPEGNRLQGDPRAQPQ